MKKIISVIMILVIAANLIFICGFACAAEDKAPVSNNADDVTRLNEKDASASENKSCKSDESGENTGSFKFEPSNFVKNLKWMAVGMGGIFVVMGVIILITAILNKTTAGIKKEDN